MGRKRIDPIIAKAIKKQKIAIDRMNFIGDFRIDSVHGKGQKRVSVITRQNFADADAMTKWVKEYNVHVYDSHTPVMFDAIGQARVMRKKVVYITADIEEPVPETV